MLYISCQVLNYCAVLSFGPTFQSDMALVAYVRGGANGCSAAPRPRIGVHFFERGIGRRRQSGEDDGSVRVSTYEGGR